MLIFLGWLLHFLVFGFVGEILASSAALPNPKPIGWIVGGLIPGGILILLVIWVVQFFRGKLA